MSAEVRARRRRALQTTASASRWITALSTDATACFIRARSACISLTSLPNPASAFPCPCVIHTATVRTVTPKTKARMATSRTIAAVVLLKDHRDSLGLVRVVGGWVPRVKRHGSLAHLIHWVDELFWRSTPIASDPPAYGRPLFFCSTTTNPRMEWFYVGNSVVKAERTRVGRDRPSEPGPNASNDGVVARAGSGA